MKITSKKKLLLVAITSLLLIPLIANTANGSEDLTETAKLVPGSGMGGSWYGYAAGISGDTAVTGASFTDSTYVFKRQLDGEWKEKNLTMPQTFWWIFSVAVSGDTVVFGDPALGSVYVFREIAAEEGEEWVKEDLVLVNPVAPPSFGCSVAIEGDTLVVGAPFNGSAHVFTRNGSTWTEYKDPLTPREPTDGYFGHSVAIAGNTVVVGAPPLSEFGSGSAHVFTFNDKDSTWTETQILTADNEEAGDYFGAALAIDGDSVVVGAPQFLAPLTMPSADSPPAPGSAHVFRGEMWNEQYTLTSTADGFGSSVAISGNTVVVGAPFDQNNEGVVTGSAHVFTIPKENLPELEQRLLTSDGHLGDQLGWSVAMDGSTVLVGALYADDQVANSGAAYVYTLPLSNQPPTAEAIADPEEAKEFEQVFLEGSGDDPDGDPLKLEYLWEQIETGGPPVELFDFTEPTAYFYAPELTNGCETLTFQLTVTDEKGEPSEPVSVKVKVRPNNTIKAKLGGKRRHGWYWHKYTFDGSSGDEITIRLEADPDGWHRGEKATLILKDKTRGVRLSETKKGSLPLSISTTLEADGKYAVYVFKKPRIRSWRHNTFEGDYILTLEGACGKLGTSYRCKKK